MFIELDILYKFDLVYCKRKIKLLSKKFLTLSIFLLLFYHCTLNETVNIIILLVFLQL